MPSATITALQKFANLPELAFWLNTVSISSAVISFQCFIGLARRSIQRLRSLVQNLEIFVVRVNAAVVAPGGFADYAEVGQVFEGRGQLKAVGSKTSFHRSSWL